MPYNKPENKSPNLAEFYAVMVPLALIAGIALAALSIAVFP